MYIKLPVLAIVQHVTCQFKLGINKANLHSLIKVVNETFMLNKMYILIILFMNYIKLLNNDNYKK